MFILNTSYVYFKYKWKLVRQDRYRFMRNKNTIKNTSYMVSNLNMNLRVNEIKIRDIENAANLWT